MKKIAVGIIIGYIFTKIFCTLAYDQLRVWEVDRILDQIKMLNPQTRIALKSLLYRNGIMERGEVHSENNLRRMHV
jgi:hypothetical protein